MFALLLREIASTTSTTIYHRLIDNIDYVVNQTCGLFCSENSQNSTIYNTIKYPVKNEFNITSDDKLSYPIENMNNSEISIDTLLLNAEINYVHEFNATEQPTFDKDDFISKWREWSKNLPSDDECWYSPDTAFDTYNYHFECLIYFVSKTNYEFHTHDNQIKYYMESYQEITNIHTTGDVRSYLDKYVVLMNSIEYFHTFTPQDNRNNPPESADDILWGQLTGLNKLYVYNKNVNLIYYYLNVISTRPNDVCLITSLYDTAQTFIRTNPLCRNFTCFILV